MKTMFSQRNEISGSVLIASLWVVVILSLLSLSVVRYAQGGIRLTKRLLENLHSRYAAVAFVLRTIRQEEQNEVLFKDFKTEERKININTIAPYQYRILEELLQQFDIDEEAAHIIAASIIDWKDADDVVFQEAAGAEESYYASLPRPYHCKNNAFDSLEELLLVRGMTPEIFQQVKNHLTIFPWQGRWRIHMETASRPVLLAWARSLTGAKTNTDLADAGSLVEKILNLRAGKDGQEDTDDDQPIDPQKMALVPAEDILLRLMFSSRIQTPQVFSVENNGMQAIVDRRAKAILAWRRAE